MEQTINETQKRPIVVTIICWFIIIGSLITPVTVYFIINNPEMADIMGKGSALPLIAQYVLMGIGALISLWSAIGMLKGKKNARTVYTIYTIIAFTINILASNMKESLIGGVLMAIIMIGLLYIPSANRYFTSNDA